MAVTHTTIGFKGTVDQIGEAQRMALLGPRGTVTGPTSWRVINASGDRTVAVLAGGGQACGVRDTTTAVDTVQLPANGTSATATRYDMIVARFIWTDPVTPVVFTYITGIPGAGGPNADALVRTPGGQYDLVLAVVRVAGGQGALNANDIFDCRAWLGTDGPVHVATAHAFLLAVIDVAELIDLSTRRHLRKVSGLWWKHAGPAETIYDNPNLGSSGLVGAGQTAGIMNIGLTAPIASDRGQLDMLVAMQAGAGSSIGQVRVTIAGIVVAKIFNIPTSPVPISFSIPFSCLAGGFNLVLEVIGSSGEACFVAFSSARVTV